MQTIETGSPIVTVAEGRCPTQWRLDRPRPPGVGGIMGSKGPWLGDTGAKDSALGRGILDIFQGVPWCP